MKEHFSKKEVLEKITPVIENTAMRYDLIPIEISLEKENGRWFLRIFIYSNNHPVNHKDCEDISRSLGDLLDEIIPFKYYLEVSSPGLDKRLKSKREFQIFKGHNIIIKVKEALDENLSKTFKGKLVEYFEGGSFSGELNSANAGSIKVFANDTEKEYEINLENIFSVRLNDIEEI